MSTRPLPPSEPEVCTLCASMPAGIEGHPKLAPHDDATHQRLFRCLSCATLWQRSYVGSGEFLWIPLATGVGGRGS